MMSCEGKSWIDYVIELLPSILMFIMVGGGGATVFKFRDKLKKLFGESRIMNRIFPKPSTDIEMGNVDKNITATAMSPRRRIDKSESIEMIAARHIMERSERRKSLA